MLHSTMSLLGMTGGLALTLTACDPGLDSDDLEALEPETELELRSGGDWGCRTCGYSNSPMFGVHPIDRFAHKDGSLWAELKLTALQSPGGDRYPVLADAHAFVADTPTGLVQGMGLSGWSLVLDDGVIERLVQITAYQEHPDWVDGQWIPTYGLAYFDPADPESPLLNVCPGLPPDETSVVLLTDELYDIEGKTVHPNEPGWVTMACRGHALAKMKFMGHDPNDQYDSSWQQRQAALKMITADYCGKGLSFTAVGQPLAWIDERGNFPEHLLPSVDGVEARWSEDGALCLDTPRLVPREEVDDWCSIPVCGGDASLEDARWVSLLPKP